MSQAKKFLEGKIDAEEFIEQSEFQVERNDKIEIETPEFETTASVEAVFLDDGHISIEGSINGDFLGIVLNVVDRDSFIEGNQIHVEYRLQSETLQKFERTMKIIESSPNSLVIRDSEGNSYSFNKV